MHSGGAGGKGVVRVEVATTRRSICQWADLGPFQSRRARGDRQIGREFALGGDVPLPNARALDDPGVAGVDRRRQLVIADDPGGYHPGTDDPRAQRSGRPGVPPPDTSSSSRFEFGCDSFVGSLLQQIHLPRVWR